MKHCLTSVLFAIGIEVLLCAAAMSFSRPNSATERFGIKATASATTTGSDGALFERISVSVAASPLHELPFAR